MEREAGRSTAEDHWAIYTPTTSDPDRQDVRKLDWRSDTQVVKGDYLLMNQQGEPNERRSVDNSFRYTC